MIRVQTAEDVTGNCHDPTGKQLLPVRSARLSATSFPLPVTMKRESAKRLLIIQQSQDVLLQLRYRCVRMVKLKHSANNMLRSG